MIACQHQRPVLHSSPFSSVSVSDNTTQVLVDKALLSRIKFEAETRIWSQNYQKHQERPHWKMWLKMMIWWNYTGSYSVKRIWRHISFLWWIRPNTDVVILERRAANHSGEWHYIYNVMYIMCNLSVASKSALVFVLVTVCSDSSRLWLHVHANCSSLTTLTHAYTWVWSIFCTNILVHLIFKRIGIVSCQLCNKRMRLKTCVYGI